MAKEMIAAAQHEAAKPHPDVQEAGNNKTADPSFDKDSRENNRICEKCPVCKIEIGASSVFGFGRHTFLLYTFYEGDRERKIFYRYGPSGDNPYPSDPDNTESKWKHNKDYTIVRYIEKSVPWWKKEYSAYGRVRGVYGEWEGSHEQVEWKELGSSLVEVAKGAEWCGKYLQLVQIMHAIVEKGRHYGPFGANCNAGTNTMLRRLSLPFKEPDGGLYPSSGIDILE